MEKLHNNTSPPRSQGKGLLWWAFLSLAVLWISASAGPQAQLANQECMKCHGEQWITEMRPEALAAMVRIPEGESPVLRERDNLAGLYIDTEAFKQSAHAGIGCAQCHPGIERLPHYQRLPAIACSDCHTDSQRTLINSVHAAEDTSLQLNLPACVDCHGSAHEVMQVDVPRSYSQATEFTRHCESCHQDGMGGEDYAATYRENVHGDGLFNQGLVFSATCYDCHGAHNVLPAENPDSTIHHMNVQNTCGECHVGIRELYLDSIHGQELMAGNTESANCSNCHHSHGIRAIGPEFHHAIVEECSTCHLELGESYLESYHGKATTLGSDITAVCSSCHGSHEILPPEHPESRVNEANLVSTCGECHEGVNANFTKYISHVDVRSPEEHPQVFYTWLVMTVLLLSVLAVFVPHGLLWFQRSFLERVQNPRGYHAAPPTERWVLRFRPLHRFTHFLIVISFMGLVATGFPLKYSYAGWAQSMATMMGGSHVMGLLHRGFALITFLYAGIHLTFLGWFFYKHCPAPRWRFIIGPDSMLFNRKDLTDFFAMLKWFFWRGPRPKFDRWTYFEKFDYWGEIWGIFVIGGTGIILWFPMLFTRWMPGWILNCAMVVHSIEALLAASVIFLVHFFNTHLRPEKFPVDMVMLTGRMTESEMKEERPAEYQRLVESGLLEKRIVKPVPFKWRLVGAIFGIIAFLFGMFLIVMAIRSEIGHILLGS